MHKHIAIPKELIKDISLFAEDNGFSFSQALDYLAYLGLSKLAEIGLAKKSFVFVVDMPKKSNLNRNIFKARI